MSTTSEKKLRAGTNIWLDVERAAKRAPDWIRANISVLAAEHKIKQIEKAQAQSRVTDQDR